MGVRGITLREPSLVATMETADGWENIMERATEQTMV